MLALSVRIHTQTHFYNVWHAFQGKIMQKTHLTFVIFLQDICLHEHILVWEGSCEKEWSWSLSFIGIVTHSPNDTISERVLTIITKSLHAGLEALELLILLLSTLSHWVVWRRLEKGRKRREGSEDGCCGCVYVVCGLQPQSTKGDFSWSVLIACVLGRFQHFLSKQRPHKAEVTSQRGRGLSALASKKTLQRNFLY